MALLRPVEYAKVAPFKSVAARDRVSVSETRGTHWFLWEDKGEIVGFGALLGLSAGARIKGIWVKPEHRGLGHGTSMTVTLIAMATEDMKLRHLEVLAHNPKFYEAMGWKRIGSQPNGAIRLEQNF